MDRQYDGGTRRVEDPDLTDPSCCRSKQFSVKTVVVGLAVLIAGCSPIFSVSFR
jgi:hypothetical protein